MGAATHHVSRFSTLGLVGILLATRALGFLGAIETWSLSATATVFQPSKRQRSNLPSRCWLGNLRLILVVVIIIFTVHLESCYALERRWLETRGKQERNQWQLKRKPPCKQQFDITTPLLSPLHPHGPPDSKTLDNGFPYQVKAFLCA